MDILLATINAKWIHPSLALRLLRANLGDVERRSAIVEWQLRQPLAERLAAVAAARPRILALSVSIWNHSATLELLRALTLPAAASIGFRPVVVLGGPEASNLPTDSPLFAHCDYLIRGEGELVFADLCRALLAGAEAPAGWSRAERSDGGGFWRYDAAPPDLARIDPGYRLYSADDLRRKLTYVEASRGCPFGCDFCLSSLDRRVRDFPLAPFLANMAMLWDRGARSFKFLDRTFNLDIARAEAIMAFFLARLDSGAYVHFEMVPSRFPERLRALLTRFPPGSLRLEVGIQTLNPQVAAAISRVCDPEADMETLAFLRRETTAIVHADLIVGLPGEDLASFGAGFDRLWTCRPTEIQVGILKRLPGTPLARHDESCGMAYAADPPYEVMATAALPAPDVARLKHFARFWELIVNRGNFTEETAAFLGEGRPVFRRFLALSEALAERFGRNWGIDRAELRPALVDGIARIEETGPSE